MKRKLRIEWLRNNPAVWDGYTFTGRRGLRNHRSVFQMMQVAGLYSWSTNWFDARIEPLIRQAKEHRCMACK